MNDFAPWVRALHLPRFLPHVVPSGLAAAVLTVSAAAYGEIHRFRCEQDGTRNYGVWRLTHDPAIRDEANYHNIQCWSHNGRYTCYTHWGGADGPGGKASAGVHVVDLHTGEDRLVDTGINPRWANHHNWLFFCHWTQDGNPPFGTGTQVIRYDADTGAKIVITHGMEGPGSLDSTDTWLYGVQRFRGQTPENVTVRVRNRPDSEIEVIDGAPNRHGYVHANPCFPLVMVRAKDPSDPVYGMNRGFFDLDGANVRIAAVMGETGHMAWSGDGRYLLIGNRQVCGRPWNAPFPSDIEVMSWGSLGDICPCGRSGRFICGANLSCVDTRSGDVWRVIAPGSYRIYPMAGDHSTLSDIDPKGSPDGTKIHYHSTLDLETTRIATITAFDSEHPDVIHVDSTAGFAESGDIVCRWEVIGYESRTDTAFCGITRQKCGTRLASGLGTRKGRVLLPLSAYQLRDAEKARAMPDPSMARAELPDDHPLMYQRFTDCYVVVARLPSRPHLRLNDGRVELVPGEAHWETQGYRVLRDGVPLRAALLRPRATFTVPGPGTYTATAVEWSNLESPPSLPLQVETPTEGSVLSNTPADFSRTREVWTVAGSPASRADALGARQATMSVMHLHDGVIALEEWQDGRKVLHADLDEQGRPIRFLHYDGGRLVKRVYRDPDGLLRSEEFFGDDGFKTEYVRYRPLPVGAGPAATGVQAIERWWYVLGRPVKRMIKHRVVFDRTDTTQKDAP